MRSSYSCRYGRSDGTFCRKLSSLRTILVLFFCFSFLSLFADCRDSHTISVALDSSVASSGKFFNRLSCTDSQCATHHRNITPKNEKEISSCGVVLPKAATLFDSSSDEPVVSVIQQPGVVNETRSITFLSSGYGTGDQEQFNNDVSLSVDALKSTSASAANMVNADPWPQYIPHINMYSVFQPSLATGVDATDTFDYVESSNKNNLKCALQIFTNVNRTFLTCSVSLIQGLATYSPEQDLLVVLVNDNTRSMGVGGDSIAIVTTTTLYLPVLLIHYLSRAAGGLADEFNIGVRGETLQTLPNCASSLEEAAARWSHFFPTSSSSSDALDKMESGGSDSNTSEETSHVYPAGCTFVNLYAPSDDCIMRSTASNVLCPVCREALTSTFSSLTSSVAFDAPRSTKQSVSISVEQQCPSPHCTIVASNNTVVLSARDFIVTHSTSLESPGLPTVGTRILKENNSTEAEKAPSKGIDSVEIQWRVSTEREDPLTDAPAHTGAYFVVPPSLIAPNGSTFVTAAVIDDTTMLSSSSRVENRRHSMVFEFVPKAASVASLPIPSCSQRIEEDTNEYPLMVFGAASVYYPTEENCTHRAPSRSYAGVPPLGNRLNVSLPHHSRPDTLPSHASLSNVKRANVLSESASLMLSSLDDILSESVPASTRVNSGTKNKFSTFEGQSAKFFIPFGISVGCSALLIPGFVVLYLLYLRWHFREVLSVTFLDQVLVIVLCSLIVGMWVIAMIVTAESNQRRGSASLVVVVPVAYSMLWIGIVLTVFCAINFCACLMRWYLLCAICAIAEAVLGVASFAFGVFAMLASVGGFSKQFQDLFYYTWEKAATSEKSWLCSFQDKFSCSGYVVSCFELKSTSCSATCTQNNAMIPCGLAFSTAYTLQFHPLYYLTLALSILSVLSAVLNALFYLRFRQISASGTSRRSFRFDSRRPVMPITFIEARIARRIFNYAARHSDGKLPSEKAIEFLTVAFHSVCTDDELKTISSEPTWTFDELMLTYFPYVQTSMMDPRMLAPEEAESSVSMLELEKKQFKRLKEFEEASGCLSPEALQNLFQDQFGNVFMPEKAAILSAIRKEAMKCPEKDAFRGLSSSELEGLRVLWVMVHPAVCGTLERQELSFFYSCSHSSRKLESLDALEKWKNYLDIEGSGKIGWREFCYPYAKMALLRKARAKLKRANCSLPPEMLRKEYVLSQFGPSYQNIFLPFEVEIPVERLAVAVMRRWSTTLAKSTLLTSFSFARPPPQQLSSPEMPLSNFLDVSLESVETSKLVKRKIV